MGKSIAQQVLEQDARGSCFNAYGRHSMGCGDGRHCLEQWRAWAVHFAKQASAKKAEANR